MKTKKKATTSTQHSTTVRLLGKEQPLTDLQNAVVQAMMRQLRPDQRSCLRRATCDILPENLPSTSLDEIIEAMSLEVEKLGRRTPRDRIRDCLVGLRKRKIVRYGNCHARFYVPADEPKKLPRKESRLRYRLYRVDPRQLSGDLSRLDLSGVPCQIKEVAL